MLNVTSLEDMIYKIIYKINIISVKASNIQCDQSRILNYILS